MEVNTNPRSALWRSGALASVPFCLLVILPFFGCQRATNGAARAEAPQRGLLHVEPALVELGQLAPRAKANAEVTLNNPTDAPVEIAKIDSSCDCLTMEPQPRRLAPGDAIRCQLRLDLAKVEDFRGNVGIEFEGKTPQGGLAFALEVRFQIPRDAVHKGE